jgi:hypothetical protein
MTARRSVRSMIAWSIEMERQRSNACCRAKRSRHRAAPATASRACLQISGYNRSIVQKDPHRAAIRCSRDIRRSAGILCRLPIGLLDE